MANKDDYLTDYREFFENFARTVNPNDQLPVKLANYKLINLEVIGGVIDWTTQYLTQKKCPPSLFAPLIQIVIDETRKSCKKQPTACGFNPSDNAYEPLKLMQTVMALTNEICMRYLENSMLCSLPPPENSQHIVSVYAAKNKRRSMEDRHVVIRDLNTMFNIQDVTPSSYYAIFDGHAGQAAAAYSSAHLHQFLVECREFSKDPEEAFHYAFEKTDKLFTEKCEVEKLEGGGTTAVCVLIRPKEQVLYVAWVGDSQALLVNRGRVLQCVNPHKPERPDEKKRIEQSGGYVCFWGTWRVNGQLAISRAIGDIQYKRWISAEPETREIPLDGGEDFLILACDGLWDHLSEDAAASLVYRMIYENPDKTDVISERLVQESKERGSTDNISVIVVFLRDPAKIASDSQHWVEVRGANMDASVDNANFSNSNNCPTAPKTDVLLNFTTSGDYKQNGDSQQNDENDFFGSNGKQTVHEIDEDDDDLGPETDVDALDDVKMLAQEVINNNPQGSFNPFIEKEEVEKAQLELDLDLQKQQSSDFDDERSPREETPTPPVDSVHGVDLLLGDSGDDSEDEWNYIKGDTATSTSSAKEEKENIDPEILSPSSFDLESETSASCEQSNNRRSQQQIAEEQEEDEEIRGAEAAGLCDNSETDDDNMSQLNPDAAEFVPVSPTRSITSPICNSLFVQDRIIAESPSKPSPVQKLISMEEFGEEFKSKPKELENADNSISESPTHNTEDLLNRKNNAVADDGTEFHFGPNAAPYTPKTNSNLDELSTRAVFGDSIISLDNNLTFNEGNTGGSAFELGAGDEPVDLNKVQELPDNLDDFVNGTESNKTPTPVALDPFADFKQNIIENLHGTDSVVESNGSAAPIQDLLGDDFNKTDEQVAKTNEEVPKTNETDEDLLGNICELASNIDLNQSFVADSGLLDTSGVCELSSTVPNVIEDISSLNDVGQEKPDLILAPTLREASHDLNQPEESHQVEIIPEIVPTVENPVTSPNVVTEEPIVEAAVITPEVITPVSAPVMEPVTEVPACPATASVTEVISAPEPEVTLIPEPDVTLVREPDATLIPEPEATAAPVPEVTSAPVTEVFASPATEIAAPVTAVAAAVPAAAKSLATAPKKTTKTGAKVPPKSSPSQATKSTTATAAKQQPRVASARTSTSATKTNGEVKTSTAAAKRTTLGGATGVSATRTTTTRTSTLTKTNVSNTSTARSTTTRTVTSATATSAAPKPALPRTTARIPPKTTSSTLNSARSTTSTTRTNSASTTNAAKPSTARVPPKSATSTLSTSRGTATTRNVSSAATTNNTSKPSPQSKPIPKTITKSPQIQPRETKTSKQRTAVKSATTAETVTKSAIAKTNGKPTATTNARPKSSAVPSAAASAKEPLVNKTARASGEMNGTSSSQNNTSTGAPI